MDYWEEKEKRAKTIQRKQKEAKSYGMFKSKPVNTKKHQLAELRRSELSF